jgi:uncharacterized protein YjbI with pentapeptide repeats
MRPGPGSKGGLSRWLVSTIALGGLSIGATLSMAGAMPASATTTIGGCTIVADPTPTSHTRCPGADLSGADLTTTDLSYAQLNDATLSGAVMARCVLVPPPDFSVTCTSTNLTDARLTGASLSGAVTSACVSFQGTPTILDVQCGGVTFTGADMRRSVLTGTDLSSAELSDSQLSGASFAGASLVGCQEIAAIGYQQCEGADLTGAVLHRADLANFDLSAVNFSGTDLTGSDLHSATLGFTEPVAPNFPTEFTGANLTRADLSGTDITMADLSQANLDRTNLTTTSLVPADQTVPHTSAKGAVVTWPSPSAQPGATPGPCNRASGSPFRIGTTTVKCSVTDSHGHRARGTFTVTVT